MRLPGLRRDEGAGDDDDDDDETEALEDLGELAGDGGRAAPSAECRGAHERSGAAGRVMMIDVSRRADVAEHGMLRHGRPIIAAYCFPCGRRVVPLEPGHSVRRRELAAFLLEHTHPPELREGPYIPPLVIRTGEAMNDGDRELLWCDDCGKIVPWRHPHRPTIRARVANGLLRRLSRVRDAIERFRDVHKPAGKP